MSDISRGPWHAQLADAIGAVDDAAAVRVRLQRLLATYPANRVPDPLAAAWAESIRFELLLRGLRDVYLSADRNGVTP